MGASETAPGTPGRCLNCNSALVGAYCSACGQPARLRPLSLGHLLAQVADDIFDIDSKAWRSLLPLMFRPGYLTRQYVAGRRARYVAPLRLYLTASVLFFVVAAVTNSNIPISWSDGNGSAVQIEVDGQTSGMGAMMGRDDGCDAILADAQSPWAAYWRERAVRACRKVSADKGVSLERAAVDNIPIMMVVFIPVLALVMKILYPLSRRFYAEHVVFFLHYHAFGFLTLLLLIVAYELGTLLQWSAGEWRVVAWLGAGYMMLYLFLAMWRVYCQGLLATFAKYCLLFIAYITGLALSLTGVVLYTALTL